MFHVKPSMYKKGERYGTFVYVPYCSPLFLIYKITCLIFPAYFIFIRSHFILTR